MSESRKIAPPGTLSSLTDEKETFKFLLTLPKALMADLDALYPRRRFGSRSKVVESILRRHLYDSNLVAEGGPGDTE